MSLGYLIFCNQFLGLAVCRTGRGRRGLTPGTSPNCPTYTSVYLKSVTHRGVQAYTGMAYREKPGFAVPRENSRTFRVVSHTKTYCSVGRPIDRPIWRMDVSNPRASKVSFWTLFLYSKRSNPCTVDFACKVTSAGSAEHARIDNWHWSFV